MPARKVYRKFISQYGEIFEGSRSELMKEKGIKHKTGLTRPAGAPDKDNVRWLRYEVWEQNGEAFVRKPLLLGPTRRCGKDHKGRFTTWIEAASNTADVYLLAKEWLARPVEEQHDPEITEWAKNFIINTEAKYVIVDNAVDDNPYALRVKAIQQKMKSEFKWARNNPELYKEYKKLLRKANQYADKEFREARTKMEVLTIAKNDGVTERSLLKMAAAAGKLKEFKAGEWYPDI